MTHLGYANPHDFDMALIPPVFAMMRRGIRVDEEKRNELHDEYNERWVDKQEKLAGVCGFNLNVNSPKQMKAWLYDDLGLPKKYRTDPRTYEKHIVADEAALRSLMSMCGDKIHTLKTANARERWLRGYISIRLVLDIRGIRKRLSSYIDVPTDADGRMRSTISVGGTETGRFSHSKTLWGTGCNLATIPRELRSFFIADEGMELAEFDLNRGESWVYAHLSQDPELLRIHKTGADFHSETAAAISTAFGEALTVEWIIANKHGAGYKIRYLGKRVNHASSYRMGPFRGAEVVNSEADDTGIVITTAQMREAQELWLQKYWGIKSWWRDIDMQLENSRRLTTPYGRERIFYGWMSDRLKKEATAYVPQSTSVDYLNSGMLRVYNALDEDNGGFIQLLHQNHDSILVQYPVGRRDEVAGEIKRLIESVVVINGCEVTIPVESGYGQTWKEAA